MDPPWQLATHAPTRGVKINLVKLIYYKIRK